MPVDRTGADDGCVWRATLRYVVYNRPKLRATLNQHADQPPRPIAAEASAESVSVRLRIVNAMDLQALAFRSVTRYQPATGCARTSGCRLR